MREGYFEHKQLKFDQQRPTLYKCIDFKIYNQTFVNTYLAKHHITTVLPTQHIHKTLNVNKCLLIEENFNFKFTFYI